MKFSIRISVVAIVLIALNNMRVNAQTTEPAKSENSGSGILMSIGPIAGIPVGSLHDHYNFILGGSAAVDFPIIKEQLYAIVGAGYLNIFSKSQYNVPDVNLIPAKAGFKYFPVKFFYLQGTAGATFVTNKAALGYSKTAAFDFSPQAGVVLNLSGKNYIDAGFLYDRTSSFVDGGNSGSVIGIRVAYAFGL